MAVVTVAEVPRPPVVIVTAPYAPAGPLLLATSHTENNTSLGIGEYSFALEETGVGFVPGIRVRASVANDVSNWIEGPVTAFDGINLTMSADLTGGLGGIFQDWNINLAGQPGKTGAKGDTGAQGPPGAAVIPNNPVLTGTPTCPTAPLPDNSQQIANTAHVKLVAATLQPIDPDLTALAAASAIGAIYYRSAADAWAPVTIGTNISFVGGTLSAVLTGTAPINDPIFTGDPRAPTAPKADNDTSIATTEHVKQVVADYAPLVSPNLTGIPSVSPTPDVTDSSWRIANTEYVKLNIATRQPLDSDLTSLANITASNVLVYRSAPDTWAPVTIGANLLFEGGELSATGAGGGGVPSDSPVFTGNPRVPTPPADDADTTIANTAWVQGELADYARLASPSFSGNPQAPTPSPGDADQSIATTGFVANAVATGNSNTIATLRGTASTFYDTFGEVEVFLNNVNSTLPFKANLDSPALTGTPTAPTAPLLDQDTSIANTEFVQQNINARSVVYSNSQTLTLSQKGLALVNIGAAQNNLINGKIVESRAANAATFSIKTFTGADPSASDPVACVFSDGSFLVITSAVSLTLPAGAQCAGNAVATAAFRLWILLFNDGGTPRLAVYNGQYFQTAGNNAQWSSPPLDNCSAAVATPPANTPWQIWSNANISAKPYRFVARADYDAGLATVGNWNVAPSRLIMIGANSHLMGSVVKTYSMRGNFQTPTTSTAWTATGIQLNIVLTSPQNFVRISAYGDMGHASTASNQYFSLSIQASNGARIISVAPQVVHAGYIGSQNCAWSLEATDYPCANVTYQVFMASSNGQTGYCPATCGWMTADEIMV